MSRGDSLIHVERQILLTAMLRASSLPDMPLLPKHFASEQHADLWELVLDNLADQLQAMFFDPAGLREARATVERLAEAAQFARTVLNAKGGPLAFERDDATERLDAALNSFGGEV